jgi:hypothetical protein
MNEHEKKWVQLAELMRELGLSVDNVYGVQRRITPLLNRMG